MRAQGPEDAGVQGRASPHMDPLMFMFISSGLMMGTPGSGKHGGEWSASAPGRRAHARGPAGRVGSAPGEAVSCEGGDGAGIARPHRGPWGRRVSCWSPWLTYSEGRSGAGARPRRRRGPGAHESPRGAARVSVLRAGDACVCSQGLWSRQNAGHPPHRGPWGRRISRSRAFMHWTRSEAVRRTVAKARGARARVNPSPEKFPEGRLLTVCPSRPADQKRTLRRGRKKGLSMAPADAATRRFDPRGLAFPRFGKRSETLHGVRFSLDGQG